LHAVAKNSSKDYIHCYHFPPCVCVNGSSACLKDEVFRKKSASTMRHDNLERHIEAQPPRKVKCAVRNTIVKSVTSMFPSMVRKKSNVDSVS